MAFENVRPFILDTRQFDNALAGVGQAAKQYAQDQSTAEAAGLVAKGDRNALMGWAQRNPSNPLAVQYTNALAKDVLNPPKADPNAELNRRYKEARIEEIKARINRGGSAGAAPKYLVVNGRLVRADGSGVADVTPETAVRAQGGDEPSNIREWQAYQQMSPEQKAEYIRMKRANPYLDTGTEFTQPNPVDPTAQPRVIPKNVAEEESQKVQGKVRGENIANAPKAKASLASANAKTDIVLGAINDAKRLTSGWSVGAGSLLSSIPGTQARDLKARADTILANLGFEELQDMRNNSPTGGALGAIAVQELQMLQATKASLDQAQTVGQYLDALNRLEKIMSGSKQRRQQAFEETYGGAPMPQFNVAPGGSSPLHQKYGLE